MFLQVASEWAGATAAMRRKIPLHWAMAVAILFSSVHQEAASNDKANPCAAAPYGMTPAAYAFWKEGVVDAAKATASIQEVCRMKFRQISRKPLHELGFNDEIIDHASPISLMYQRMGALRFAAQIPEAPSRPKSALPKEGKRTIRPEDLKTSEQRFQRAVYDLAFNGNFGSDLQMLGRLGVTFQDRQGRARNYGDVLTDTAAALQRVVASGQMTKQEAEFTAREAGFYGSVATALANNDPSLASAFRETNAER